MSLRWLRSFFTGHQDFLQFGQIVFMDWVIHHHPVDVGRSEEAIGHRIALVLTVLFDELMERRILV